MHHIHLLGPKLIPDLVGPCMVSQAVLEVLLFAANGRVEHLLVHFALQDFFLRARGYPDVVNLLERDLTP